MNDDEITVVGYINSSDKHRFLTELKEHDCNPNDSVEVYGNNICVPLRIEDDFKEYYIDGKGFRNNGGSKMRVLFNSCCCADEILDTI